MDKKVIEYTIGEKTYIQKPLVLGQITQLVDILDGLELRADMTPEEIISALKGVVPSALAVVLCEKDKKLADKDLDLTTKEFKFALDLDTTQAIITDFFDCNPIVSLLLKLRENTTKIINTIASQVNGSTNSA